ncbi:MAG: flagellar biosynthetic protein FliP [Gammaproteobacteria bacterium RBG_16_57_12]|nr:MAG: flagellar biosynthetic protein FliP [Gammaproteobacteria bacterium RBG_16_57_12]
MTIICAALAIYALPGHAAEPGLPALTITTNPNGSQTYSLSLQVLALMTALSLLPTALIMMTSFTRIIIVLAILRQALGLAQTPSNQILVGLALFLSFFIMSPVFDKANQNALQPYLNEKISASEALVHAGKPFKEFMLSQTRDNDLATFARISGTEQLDAPDDVPFRLLMPAFVTSEVKTAFQIGFLIFIPFVIIDLVVASVLMAMGMMMLSPLVISLPFKLMLFVLVDGWALIMGALASSFYVQG